MSLSQTTSYLAVCCYVSFCCFPLLKCSSDSLLQSSFNFGVHGCKIMVAVQLEVGINASVSGFYSEMFSLAFRKALRMKTMQRTRELNVLFMS